MVIQQRLGGLNVRGIRFALAILGMLLVAGLALAWYTASSANQPVRAPAVHTFPTGPADRNGVDEAAIQRGASADSARYAAQVPNSESVAPTQAEEPIRTYGPR